MVPKSRLERIQAAALVHRGNNDGSTSRSFLYNKFYQYWLSNGFPVHPQPLPRDYSCLEARPFTELPLVCVPQQLDETFPISDAVNVGIRATRKSATLDVWSIEEKRTGED